MELDMNLAISSPEGLHDVRQVRILHPRAQPDAEATRFNVRRLTNRADRLFGLREGRARLFQEDLPSVGELDSRPGAFEQPHPKLRLELSNPLAQRRLSHSEPLRRATERELLRDRYEIAEV